VRRSRWITLLRSAGTPGRRAAQHVGELTDREHQIATMAAAGASTPDIAARLHLSTRTVETHLGRIYHKLGIDRRSKLADALERRES
jgi:DNA-binding NarL/FixJ family response regulator